MGRGCGGAAAKGEREVRGRTTVRQREEGKGVVWHLPAGFSKQR